MGQHMQKLTQNPQGSARAVQLQAESKVVQSEHAGSGWSLLLPAAMATAYDIARATLQISEDLHSLVQDRQAIV